MKSSVARAGRPAGAAWFFALAVAFVAGGCATMAGENKEDAMAVDPGGPRKIIVGTSMYAMWRQYPGLEKRLDELGALIDDMAKKAAERYDGAGLDVAALPEVAVNGGMKGGAAEISFPLEGPVLDKMGAKARQHHCYIVVPMFLSEMEGGKKVYYNVGVLIDREGKVAGIYRKVYPVTGNGKTLEGGCLPGKNFPVFNCDFGKLGVQVCFDMTYDAGWETLGRKGAELVIWTTQSPGQIKAAARAMENNYYLLTSTWRNNASLFDPTGHMIRVITKPEERVFVEQIDLSYVLLGWQRTLSNGKVFDEKYGKKAGYRYSEAEDGGIFWSNDPETPIMQMVKELGLELPQHEIDKNTALQDKLRGGPPSLD